MKNLSITERRSGSIVVLDLKGKIIFGEESNDFHKALRRLAERGEKKILLNFADVSCIDSSGLGELVGGYVAVGRIQGEIKLVNLSPNVLDLIECTRLSTIFSIYDDEAKAVKSFRKRGARSVAVSRAA
jgi:anti-sigma B factor antagonist